MKDVLGKGPAYIATNGSEPASAELLSYGNGGWDLLKKCSRFGTISTPISPMAIIELMGAGRGSGASIVVHFSLRKG